MDISEMTKKLDNDLDIAFKQLRENVNVVKASKNKNVITVIKGFLEGMKDGMEEVNSLFGEDATEDEYIKQIKDMIEELNQALETN